MTYADDIVIVAKNRVAIMDMKSTLNKFLDRNMEISVDKINMLVFNKKRKEKKEKWHWGNTEIEEMQEYK